MARGKRLLGVLVVNTGYPQECTRHAVKKHMQKVLSDKRVAGNFTPTWSFKLSSQVLPQIVSPMVDGYRRIWTPEGEPATIDQQRLVQGLNGALANAGYDVMVRNAVRVGSPSIEEAMEDLKRLGCEELTVLPLYPFASFTSTQIVEDEVRSVWGKTKWKGNCTVIQGYSKNQLFLRTIAASILHAGFNPNSHDRLLFSHHATPMHDVWTGDSYSQDVDAACKEVARLIGIPERRMFVGYQSRLSDGRPWTEPETQDVLNDLAKSPGRVFALCPGFAIDCVDTLDQVATVFANQYQEACAAQQGNGGGQFVYVPCLGKSRAHLKVLMDVLLPYINE